MEIGAAAAKPLSLFYSYSHRDEEFRRALEAHLSFLRRSGLIAEWHDRMIGAGGDWKGDIDKNLASADIVLLLVSADFIASDYCWSEEMTKALRRHERGEARIVPVIVRPCRWLSTPLARLQAVPKDGRAVTDWSNRDAALDDVAIAIERVIDELRQDRVRAAEEARRAAEQERLRAETVAAQAAEEQRRRTEDEARRRDEEERLRRDGEAAEASRAAAERERAQKTEQAKREIAEKEAQRKARDEWVKTEQAKREIAEREAQRKARDERAGAENPQDRTTIPLHPKPFRRWLIGGALFALVAAGVAALLVSGESSKQTPAVTAKTSTPAADPKPAPSPQKPDNFTDCEKCPEMVVIAGGTFTMGSPASEPERLSDEGPQRRVTIGPFAIGKNEVTFDQWDACVAAGGCNGYRSSDNGWGRGARPVINVSWQDAQAYVGWLAKQTGKPYRLPTEAEWEYAARAGTTTPFSFGDTISTAQANYNGGATYGNGSKGEYRGRTVPVGSLPANPWGLYEAHGNVYEWVEDCYDNYKGAPADGSPWVEPSCADRVLRGGSWNLDRRNLRSANRGWNVPVNRYDTSGFRVARTLTP